MHVRVLVVCVLVMGFLVTGCGKKKQEVEQETASRIVSKAMSLASGKETKVAVDGESISFTDNESGMTMQTGKGVKLPENFPSDIPVYEKGEILQVTTVGQDTFSTAIQTKEPRAKVVTFYKEKMAAQEWQSETTMEMPQASMLIYKKDNRTVSLMITENEEDGGTVISMSAGSDKQ